MVVRKVAIARMEKAPPEEVVTQTGITSAAIAIGDSFSTIACVSVTETVIVRAYYNEKLALKQPMRFVVVRKVAIACMEKAPPGEIVESTTCISVSGVGTRILWIHTLANAQSQ